MSSRHLIFPYIFVSLLIGSALLISFSDLLRPYGLRAWPVVLAGGGLGLLAARWRRGGEGWPTGLPWLAGLLALLAAGFTQALAANGLPSNLLRLHSLPELELIYLLLGGAAAFGLAWLHLRIEERAPGAVALAAAGLYSSVVFFRVPAVPEVGYAYSVLAGFALLALLRMRGLTWQLTKTEAWYWGWTLAFLLAQGAAVLASPAPGQSLAYFLATATTVGLAALAAARLRTVEGWRPAAWAVLGLGAGLPAVLGAIKAAAVLIDFGPGPALAYRLHPSEMGGANLIARSLLVAAPLGAALYFTGQPSGRGKWGRRAAHLGLQALILAVIVYARSFEGFFAWLAAWAVFSALAGWEGIRRYWQRVAANPALRLGHIAAGVVLALAVLYAGVRVGYSINPYSFSGRFQHWVGAIEAWKQHPLLGGGPDNEYLYTQYAGNLTVIGEAQQFVDDPLYLIRYRFGLLKVHAHNLLLETAAFSGLAGAATLVGMLAALAWLGISTWRQAGPELRLLAAACLAGIAGELAWGLLDVIRESPPFFSFPTWALIGLLVTAYARSQPAEAGGRTIDLSSRWVPRLALAGMALLVLLPAAFANRYGSGFLAFQEHRWEAASSGFRAATMINPLSNQAYWMLSKAELELGQWDRAAASLQQAISLKRGFSPYLAQAGWLAWLQGDLQAAERYFTQAVESDPLESWTPGLHANLGLLRAHQGRGQEAAAYFARSLEHHPELAQSPMWIRTRTAEGQVTAALAADYAPEGGAGGLERRIYAHLGMANISAQHFNPAPAGTEGVTLDGALDALHAMYLEAAASGDPTAHLRLAAEAEAARLAGLNRRAEAAYREYQSLQPGSAFGYQGLAAAYSAEGRLEEAGRWLEQAVQVSPNNIESLRQLALVQLARQEVGAAAETVARLAPIAASNTFQLRFFDVNLMNALIDLYRASGEQALARMTLERLAKTRATPEDFLRLAEADFGAGEPREAGRSCWRAYDELVRNWARPYDSRLWQAARCVARSTESDEAIERRASRAGPALTRQLFLGHVAQMRNQPEAAEAHYRLAAGLNAMESAEAPSAPHYYLGELYLALNRAEEAENELRTAAGLDERESLALLSLGRMYENRGDLPAALDAYRAAAERTPGSVEAQLGVANLHLRSGDPGEAQAPLQIARQLAGEDGPPGQFDLIAGLAGATFSEGVADGLIRGSLCAINGEQQVSIFMHPVSWAKYQLQLPDPQAGEGIWLAFGMGLLPESWDQAGDGVEFSVSVSAPGGEEQVYSYYLNPKEDPSQRRWETARIDLSAFAGQEITLTLRTGGGEAGDIQFDWPCWGNPVIEIQ